MTVFWQIRLPRCRRTDYRRRTGDSGAAYQGMFRNPLVSPDILVFPQVLVSAIREFCRSVNAHYPAVRLHRRALCVFRSILSPGWRVSMIRYWRWCWSGSLLRALAAGHFPDENSGRSFIPNCHDLLAARRLSAISPDDIKTTAR